MDYLTVKEVAELKGCTERYIKRLCKEGKIKAEKQFNSEIKQTCYMISDHFLKIYRSNIMII